MSLAEVTSATECVQTTNSAARTTAATDSVTCPTTQYHCDVCDKSFQLQIAFTTHMESKSHARHLSEVHSSSDLTNSGSSGDDLRSESQPPSVTVTASGDTQTPAAVTASASGGAAVSSSPAAEHVCTLCSVTVNSIDQLNIHRDGAKHRTNVERSRGAVITNMGAYNPVRTYGNHGDSMRWRAVANPHYNVSHYSRNLPHGGVSAQPATGMRAFTAMPTGSVVRLTGNPASGHLFRHRTPSSAISAGCHCDICNVTVTAMTEMQAHLEGAKHKAKLASLEQGASNSPTTTSSGTSKSSGTALDAVKKEESEMTLPIGITRSKTPNDTNVYQCHVCNVHMNSTMQLKQHMNSSNHKNGGRGGPAKMRFMQSGGVTALKARKAAAVANRNAVAATGGVANSVSSNERTLARQTTYGVFGAPVGSYCMPTGSFSTAPYRGVTAQENPAVAAAAIYSLGAGNYTAALQSQHEQRLNTLAKKESQCSSAAAPLAINAAPIGNYQSPQNHAPTNSYYKNVVAGMHGRTNTNYHHLHHTVCSRNNVPDQQMAAPYNAAYFAANNSLPGAAGSYIHHDAYI